MSDYLPSGALISCNVVVVVVVGGGGGGGGGVLVAVLALAQLSGRGFRFEQQAGAACREHH